MGADPTVSEARLLDEIAAAATVAPLDDDIAGWRAKASPDVPFRRANAVLPPLGAASDRASFDEALEAVRAWYARLGQRLIVQVSSADPEVERLDAWLAEAGLEVEAPVHIHVSRSAVVSTRPRATVMEVRAGIDEAWTSSAGTLVDGDDTHRHRTAAYGRALAPRGEAALGASARIGGGTVGVGLGVVDRGWLGIFGMATSPAHRRQGIASQVVASLRAEASRGGATATYLQVETDNAPAIALYEGLGFERHHGYHYRSEPAVPPGGR